MPRPALRSRCPARRPQLARLHFACASQLTLQEYASKAGRASLLIVQLLLERGAHFDDAPAELWLEHDCYDDDLRGWTPLHALACFIDGGGRAAAHGA